MVNKTARQDLTSSFASKLDEKTWKDVEFAARLRSAREEKRISQENLAKLVGVSNTTIQNYESGQYPKGEHAIGLARALSCSLDWLLMGECNAPRKEAPPLVETIKDAPPEDCTKQLAVANERLYQAWEREREVQKEISELKAEVAMLRERERERVAAREQMLRDARDIYELQEADIGAKRTSAEIAPSRTSTSR